MRKGVIVFKKLKLFLKTISIHTIDTMSIQKNILLLIDPQEDFMDKAETFMRCAAKPSSGLPVINSMNDINRIIAMITRDVECFKKHGYCYFDEIHLTMDSHLSIHIGHYGFWKRVDGISVEPGVVFMLNEKNEIVNANEIGDALPGTVVYEAHEPFLQSWAVKYIQRMITVEKIHPLIWNTHCIRHSDGWQIEESLFDIIRIWATTTKKSVFIHEKGENILCEMYSVMRAVIPFEEMIQEFDETARAQIIDYTCLPSEIPPLPAIIPISFDHDNKSSIVNYSTRCNKVLFEHLCGTVKAPNRVFVGGQAKSHCVNRSVRDIVECIEATPGLRTDRIVILEDVMSNVVLPDTLKGSEGLNYQFKTDGDTFIRNMVSKGVRVIRTIDVFPLP